RRPAGPARAPAMAPGGAATGPPAASPRVGPGSAAGARHFPGPYARCPHGSVEGIDASSIDDARSWWQERNATARTIVSLAGAVTHEHALELVGGLMPTETSDAPLPDPVGESPRGYDHITDPSNQVQIIVISDAPPAQDETAALRQRLCTHVLSGGMSSRLFTEVREKRGLCYTVSASYRASRSLGTLHSYVGTTPERAQESLDVLADELVRITTAQGLVTQDEFDRAIAGMKANVVFHGESTAARASALVSDLDRLGRVRPLDEVTDAIDRLTIDDVNEHASVMSFENSTVQTLGPEPLGLPSVLA
ncbi:MAG: insulinase family protein, partial [Planctomycetota bacterium]